MQGRRRSGLTDADRAEWAAFARSISPLEGRALSPLAEPPAPAPGSRPVSAPPAPVAPAPPLAIGVPPPGVDKATWNRLQGGRIPVARSLDLHGRTAQRAFQALHAFLLRAYADRLRCVEIITGRGTGEAGGVLRRELPVWLNLPELRPLVLAATHPHAANPGAVRLLLRRIR